MDKENDSGNYDVKKEDDSGWVRHSQGDQKIQHLRTRGGPSIEKWRQINMERRWNCIYGRKNICFKQQQD